MTPPARRCPRDQQLTKRQAWRTAVHRRRYQAADLVPYPCTDGHWHVGPRHPRPGAMPPARQETTR